MFEGGSILNIGLVKLLELAAGVVGSQYPPGQLGEAIEIQILSSGEQIFAFCNVQAKNQMFTDTFKLFLEYNL